MKQMNTPLTNEPLSYIMTVHFNNMIAYTNRAEVEAALAVYKAGRSTRNYVLNAILNNLVATYGQDCVYAAANMFKLNYKLVS